MITRTLLGFLLTTAMLCCGGTLERAAAKDPMKCERDPNCPKKNKNFDCSSQCADDPACVDRCKEVGISAGTQGR